MDKDNERILLANVIGECIKSLQLDKNINQKELALLSGVSERSLRRIERGQVQAVSYSILIQYNFTQTKRPEVRKNRDFRSFFRTIPQATKKPLLGERCHCVAMTERGDDQYKAVRESRNSSPLSVALTGASRPRAPSLALRAIHLVPPRGAS